MTLLDPFVPRTHIAYFSMEIAIRPEMHTYAGGLGILAGDTVRSSADLELRMVFVTLVSRAGYFRQKIDSDGRQTEEPDWWEPSKWCQPLDAMVGVPIGGRTVWLRPWLYIHSCPHGHQIPVLLLDTDLEQNTSEDRALSHYLYGGDEAYRLRQEIVLGIGGVRMLRALGFDIQTYHLNEGHAALLTLDLLKRYSEPSDGRDLQEPLYDLATVRRQCVFTTHTPVEVGHDQFPYDLAEQLLRDDLPPRDELRRLAGHDRLNTTQLALNLSGYVNGVARRHAHTTEAMFPGYRIRAITNGVHAGTWTHQAFARLYHEHIPHWWHEPELLVRVLQLPDDDIWRCHCAAKLDLLKSVKEITGQSLDPDVPVLGFARRMTGYKRPTLLFRDIDRLAALATRHPFQIVLAGKAHPRDGEGKEAIRRLHQMIDRLRGRITCVFLPGYDMDVARTVIAGCDIWLNTPLPPHEASGTSGMKGALNGVLNVSVLDGWWTEACIENVTGWSIGSDGDDGLDEHHAAALYNKLADPVLPTYYQQPAQWRWMMKQSIGHIGYHFNSQRMVRRYAAEAYLR